MKPSTSLPVYPQMRLRLNAYFPLTGDIGASKIEATTFEMLPLMKTALRYALIQVLDSWRPCVTLQLAYCASWDTLTLPKPYATWQLNLK